MFESDVFIAGGGPAGLAAAIACRQSGLAVTVADAQRPPIDKACGEGLMPEWFVAANQLGLALPEAVGAPFFGIRFVAGKRQVAARFPVGSGRGLRRTALHPLLVERALQVGVKLRWNTPLNRLDEIRARWVIGADGAQSGVRRWAGIGALRNKSPRYSYRRHYRVTPWSNFVDVHWGDRCQFYVTPLGTEEVSLILITRDPKQRLADGLSHFPELARRVRGCETLSSERGAMASARRVERVSSGDVALVGDASGTVDAITGEGLSLAFHQAIALADALTKEDLRLYERAHAAIMRRARLMGDLMLLMDRSSLLRGRAMAAFEQHPGLFCNLLALHVGQLDALRTAQTAVALGWGVVTA